jgi:murein DD-endopeptidase MepM/ murein hydrolase activator NlpD
LPNVLVCACVGAAIGTLATVVTPTPGMPLAAPSVAATAIPMESKPIVLDLSGVEDALMRTASAALMATKTVTIKAGDTLSSVLKRAGVAEEASFDVVQALRQVYNPKRLQAGQSMTLSFQAPNQAADPHLADLSFEVSPLESLSVARESDGSYSARKIIAETRRETVRYDGTISSSLSKAAAEVGVPNAVVEDFVKLFSYDVDFQRDIQEGDTFSVMFERVVTNDGRVVRNHDMSVASMTLRGTTMKFYAFRHQDGSIDFYNEKGEGVRKALTRTPINGAKLTSGFGMRRHPILGYSKMHQGIDFGAPTGTPILAAGDGIIEKREVYGGYGNYIRIRHGSGYATAYAHMSRFAADTQVGRRVKQNQVIGYVGSTGRSTGPHLHFEILRDNRQVNPMKVKFAASQKLEGAALARFKETRLKVEQQYAALSAPRTVAQLSGAAETSKLH